MTGLLPWVRRGGALFDKQRQYRWYLSRRWDFQLPTVSFIGLNPSTADEDHDDNTVRKCCNWAREWGYGSMIMLNAFAAIGTDPGFLRVPAEHVGPRNDGYIRNWLNKSTSAILCWGNDGRLHGRESQLFTLLREFTSGLELWCLGLNACGTPKHPLYLANATPRQSFTLPEPSLCLSPSENKPVVRSRRRVPEPPRSA